MARPAFLRALREMDGQIKLTWDGETTNNIRIVRRVLDYPLDINDGVVIYTGLTTGLADPNTRFDTPPDPDNIFYYRFFEETSPGVFETAQRLTDHDWFLDTAKFSQVMRRITPNMYDVSRDVVDKPELWNLMRDVVIAFQLGYCEALIDNLFSAIDVDVADGHNLSSMAAHVGLKPNRELTFTQQRAEIKNAVSSYKIKGTTIGLEQQIKAVTGALAVEIADWNLNILVANCPTPLSAQISPPDPNRNRFQRRDDPTGWSVDFVLGENYTFGQYGVYVEILKSQGLTSSQVAKISRVIGDFEPADMEATVIILDQFCLETVKIDVNEVAIVDTIQSSNFEQPFQDQFILISNDPDHESNSPESLAWFNGWVDFWHDTIEL